MKIKLKTLALLIIPLLLLAGCGKDEIPEKDAIRPVKAVQIGDPTRLIGRSFPGRASATQEANLSFRVSGPIVELPVKVGDVVKKGDLLGRIDPRDYEIRLRDMRARLEQARAALQLAQSEYDRVIRIREQDPGAVSATMVDAKEETRNQAGAQVRSLEATVAAAEDSLDYSFLRAPFGGTVVETFAENYEDVQPKQPIVRLVDCSRIEFTVNVPEKLIAYTGRVEHTTVRFDAFPGVKISAQILEVGKEASKTTRTYPVTLVMEPPAGIEILPGMAGQARAEGRLPLASDTAGIEVPLGATFSDAEGKSCVWTIDANTKKVARRAVKTGRLTNDGILVTKGLVAGEWIATAGVHSLREDQQVRILE